MRRTDARSTPGRASALWGAFHREPFRCMKSVVAGANEAAARWRAYFKQNVGGTDRELDAAVAAAFDSLRRGSDKEQAVAAGTATIRRMRQTAPPQQVPVQRAPSQQWSDITLPRDGEMDEWERLQVEKKLAERRINAKVMRRTPSGWVNIALIAIVSVGVVVGIGAFVWATATGKISLFGPPAQSVIQVTVPDVTGIPNVEASIRLADAGLESVTREVEDYSVPTFTVLRTEPAAGTTVSADTLVVIYMAFPGL